MSILAFKDVVIDGRINKNCKGLFNNYGNGYHNQKEHEMLIIETTPKVTMMEKRMKHSFKDIKAKKNKNKSQTKKKTPSSDLSER